MKHFVLTRAIYTPEQWSLEANERRLGITRALTAELMRQQTVSDWEWVVLVDPRDQLLGERLKVFKDASPRTQVLFWDDGTETQHAAWDRNPIGTEKAKIAATAYRHPGWLDATSPRDVPTLMTRLDDDDGLAVDALSRFRRGALGLKARTVLVLPQGFRIWRGKQETVRHETNAMHTLLVPPDDPLTVYDYGHRKMARVGPVKLLDDDPGWLWYRHEDTLSGWKHATRNITTTVKKLFPVDWRALA